MSNTIDIAHVQQFSDNVRHLAQQQGSKLVGLVSVKPITGKYAHFDRLGAVSAYARTSRHADVVYTDTPHSRRRVKIADYEVADLIDEQDEIRNMIDFKSPYVQNMAMALGRKMDDLIIAAALGTATAIDSSDAESSVSFLDANRIDCDFGTADSNLTLAKLIEAKRILDAADIIGDDGRALVHNASALANLLNSTTVTSADYNSVKALTNGEINTFLGFDFVMSNRLTGTLSSDPDPIKCLAIVKSGLGLALGQDINVRMDVLPQKSHAIQVLGKMTMGATRIEEEKVVNIECYQTA